MSKTAHLFILSFILIATACEERGASRVQFETGAGSRRGHEDITRYGVERANAQLLTIFGIDPFYPVPKKGVAGIDTGNMIVRGNFETDFPEKKFLNFYQAKSRLPLVRWVDWHNSPTLQHLHGLRNHPDGVFQDKFATCREVTAAIGGALEQALPLLVADSGAEAGQFWLGHATHIIQDTFSRAHTVRVNDKQLVDHCSYGLRDAALCYHEESDSRDHVLKKDGGSCEFDPNNRNWSCLVPEARAAALATAGFLSLAGGLALDPSRDAKAELERWFEGDPALFESGYFDCRPMGIELLDAYFHFVSDSSLLPSERAILNERLKTEGVPELKVYLFKKYAGSIIEQLTGVTLEDDLLARYTPYLASFGHRKLADKIFIDDAIELVKRRVLALSGKPVDPLWLPQFTLYLVTKRSIARLDEEIKRQSSVPSPAPPLDSCGNLPTPLEVIACRTEAARSH